ncbi:hypothetical protein TSUD_100960 [Trifolium subterraneum]|uniref:Uncharacterized protein n=1 Tax=Trifolium subterraneum TaxID=3900 RepID=A0A2Z6NCI3_TRISU|nr:hypothetical protein TSUD_100960 [Trifolium subterraneum]
MASTPNCGQCLQITQTFIDLDYLPTRRMFKDNNRNILIRQHAVSVIAKVDELAKKMIELCHRMNIVIDKIEVAAEETEAEKQRLAKDKGKGKAVEKVKEPRPQMEAAISNIEPRKHMNFELKWATDHHISTVSHHSFGITHVETLIFRLTIS